MKVEVILSQVREQRDLEVDRVGPMQRKRMRGDLHDAGLVPFIQHPPKGRLEVDGLGSGPLDRLFPPPTTCLTVPSKPHRTPAASRTSRIKNAVVVFPFVPVIPTTFSLPVGSPQNRAASGAIAARASPTTT